MRINIKEIDADHILDVNQCNDEFTVDSVIVLNVKDNVIGYSTLQVPITKKRYSKDIVDYTSYINKQDKVVYLAYVEGQIAGQIILRKNWNKYAYIEDIAVDVQFRRKGVGTELISRAKKWANNRRLMGIMLETQNNNVPACKFYESCGFQLRGFDTYLYKGIDPATSEVALYWYWFCDKELPDKCLDPGNG
jgi:streptothricin acetyltransferase